MKELSAFGNQHFKAALFDLDGVVFDTEPGYTVFWGTVFSEYYPEQPHLERLIKGQTLTQIFDQWYGGDLEKERASIQQRLNEFEATMPLPYVAGFQSFVKGLRQRGVKTAVVTSSNQAKMASVYRRVPEFKGLFDKIFTSEDFCESKPSPDCYLTAARNMGVNIEDCIVFEDSFNGLRAGMASGARVVGLTTSNPKEQIAELSHIQVADFNELSVKMI